MTMSSSESSLVSLDTRGPGPKGAGSITRCFLVGCPRSGTTLLQSMIAAHSRVLSLPETAFFINMRPTRALFRWLERCGVTSRKTRNVLLRCVEHVDRPDLAALIPRTPIGKIRYVNAFRRIMDTLTTTTGKNVWVEKSPRHVYCIEEIQRYIPDARFVHIIRNGADVVGSLYDAWKKYPEQWPFAADIDYCIELWNRAVTESRKYANQPNHHLVRYEALVDQPDPVMRSAFRFMGIKYEPGVIGSHRRVVESLVYKSAEPWKQGVKNKSVEKAENKFSRLFDEKQRDYIREYLLSADDLFEVPAGSVNP